MKFKDIGRFIKVNFMLFLLEKMNQSTHYKLSLCDHSDDVNSTCKFTEIGIITRNSNNDVTSTKLSLTTNVPTINDLHRQLLESFKDKDFNKDVIEYENLKKPKVLISGETKLVIFKTSSFHPWIAIHAIQLNNIGVRYLFYAYEQVVEQPRTYKAEMPEDFYLDHVHEQFTIGTLKYYFRDDNTILNKIPDEFDPMDFGLAFNVFYL